jgi:hypothetical protein
MNYCHIVMPAAEHIFAPWHQCLIAVFSSSCATSRIPSCNMMSVWVCDIFYTALRFSDALMYAFSKPFLQNLWTHD